MICNICPRECGVDREKEKGFCGMPEKFKVARAALHFWEEPFLSGKSGSGTVFFSGCNLRCAYCQNNSISTGGFGEEVSDRRLMELFDSLIEQGAANINLVTPTHYASRLEKLLREYKSPVPVIYNCGGYEKVETLKRLEGLIDIYLPDIKYIDSERAKKYSGAPDYFTYASVAIGEMLRQTGKAVFGSDNMMKKGTVIRHLVLPKNTNQSIRIIDWLRENVPNDTYISMMSQFTPVVYSDRYSELNRKITKREYDKVVSHLIESGFENVLIQTGEAAKESFIPDFDLTGL